MGVGDVAIHLFSPAKLVYMAYIVVVVLRGVCNTSRWEFFLVSVMFVGVQIWHDDYWRIRLNARARKAEGMPAER
jgi:hypothetical protein